MFEESGVDTTGPHETAAAFHDALAKLAVKRPEMYPDPRNGIEELSGFDDNIPITFAHADLDKMNIILTGEGDGPCHLLAIIDWHQAGWYPKHWDFLKAQTLDSHKSEWVRVYLPKFLTKPKFRYHRSFEYVSMSTI
jgi:hypothetical protein